MLSCFFFFFLIIDLYYLIPVVITQILILGIPTKEATAEMEMHPVIVEFDITKCSLYNSKHYKLFYTLCSLIHFDSSIK